MDEETGGNPGDSTNWVWGFEPARAQAAGPDPGGWQPSYPPPPGAGPSGAGGSASPPPRRRGGSELRRMLAALVVVVAAGLGFAFGHGTIGSSENFSPSSTPSANGGSSSNGAGSGGLFGNSGPGGSLGSGNPFGGAPSGFSNTPSAAKGSPANVAAIAAKVSPALVDVNSTFAYDSAEGAGTGIVLSSDGLVLTNNHVVEGATEIEVTDVGNHRRYAASVVGYDSTHDIALLRLRDASGLQVARLGDSATLKVGDGVVAIGNAGGVGGTPTSAGGSITALGRTISASDSLTRSSEQLTGLIEVNADVQSGDSGGSLVNASGEVVGMDTAASQQFAFSTSASQGFAIPINRALSVAHQITAGKGGSDVHVGATAFLGVDVATPSAAPQGYGYGYGFGGAGSTTSTCSPAGYTPPTSTGAEVCSLVADAPVAPSGIARGDVITSLANRSVTSPSAITHILVRYHPDDRVELGWLDANGSRHSATVTLGKGPPQ